jgi:hypothetical protein
VNRSWFEPKHGENVHRTDLNAIYVYDRVESEWIKQDENDYILLYPQSMIDFARAHSKDAIMYQGCNYCHYESDGVTTSLSCPECEQMPLEMCDLCQELESPRFFIRDGEFKYCPNSEDYYFQRYRDGSIFKVGNRSFKWNIENGKLLEVNRDE